HTRPRSVAPALKSPSENSLGVSLLRPGDQHPGELQIEIFPAQPVETLGLEAGGCLDRLLGNLVLVAAGRNVEAIAQELHKRCANFSLELDHIAESLVLEAIRLDLGNQSRRPVLALHLPVTPDESQHGEPLLLRSPILEVRDGQVSHQRAVLGAY